MNPARSDILLAPEAVGAAIELAGEECAGGAMTVGLGTAVRLLSGMMFRDHGGNDDPTDLEVEVEVDDELCPF